MWDTGGTSGGGGTAASFVCSGRARPRELMSAGDCKFSFSHLPWMKEREDTAKLTDNIESRQYTATGAGIWLNSCMVMKATNRILFSELRIGLYLHHNAIILSCLPSEGKAVWPTCSKAEAGCDVSSLEDWTLVFTPAAERPQSCSQSLWH